MESPVSVWEDPQCPFRVEWAPDKLNQVRIAVMDAFYSMPRGGIEIGGVLLGRVEGKLLRVENYAPMECEHLTGPSFVLSPKDEASLTAQLDALGDKAVGWFHSHTRSDIHFSPQDTALHDRFFPKASQIALVLRPANSQPPTANYFFRGRGAAMVGGARPFTVEPIKGKSAAPPIQTPPAMPVQPRPAPVVKAPAPPHAPPPVKAAPPIAEPEPPVFFQEPEPARPATPGRTFLWPSVGLLILVMCAVAFFTRELWMPK